MDNLNGVYRVKVNYDSSQCDMSYNETAGSVQSDGIYFDAMTGSLTVIFTFSAKEGYSIASIEPVVVAGGTAQLLGSGNQVEVTCDSDLGGGDFIINVTMKAPFTVKVEGGLEAKGTIKQNGTPVSLDGHTHTPASIGAAAVNHGTHVSYSSTKPVMDGTASVGSASTVARSDHRHPTDTSRVPTTRKVNGKALSGDITLTAADVKALPISGGAIIRDNGISFSTGESKVQAAIVKSGDDGIWLGCANALPDAQSAVALGSIADPEYDYHAANKKYVDDAISSRSPLNHTHTAAEVGALASGGTAAAATKLATSRTIRTNLGSTSTASFNGTANITPGVTGTLGIAHGGTGSTTAAGALANLGADSRYLKLSGGDMTGDIDMQDHYITGLPAPVSISDAVNLQTVMKMIVNLATRVKVVLEYYGGHQGDFEAYVPIQKITISGIAYVYTLNGTISVPAREDGGKYTNIYLYYILGADRRVADWSAITNSQPTITFPNNSNFTMQPSTYGSYYSYNMSTLNFKSGNITITGDMVSCY